ASGNAGDGIHANSNCTLRSNQSSNNGAAGLRAVSFGSRIEGNSVSFNNVGLVVDSTGNVVIANTARGNTGGNYSIIAGNRVATVVTPASAGAVSGNIGGTAFSTDGFSNLAF